MEKEKLTARASADAFECEIFRELWLESAHAIPNIPPGHPCGQMHGHTYRIRVWFRGVVKEGEPWWMDWGDGVEPVFDEIRDRLDHKDLGTVAGLECSSGERLALWIMRFVASRLDGVDRVEVNEGQKSGATVRAGLRS